MLQIVYRIDGIDRDGDVIKLSLTEATQAPGPEPEPPEQAVEIPIQASEEKVMAARRLNAEPPPKSDTDRIMRELMQSMEKYAPGMYEQVKKIGPFQNVSGQSGPIPVYSAQMMKISRPKFAILELSEDEYRDLGSPSILDKISLAGSVASTQEKRKKK